MGARHAGPGLGGAPCWGALGHAGLDLAVDCTLGGIMCTLGGDAVTCWVIWGGGHAGTGLGVVHCWVLMAGRHKLDPKILSLSRCLRLVS